MNHKVFISYSWKDAELLAANTIDSDWQDVGFKLIRDKRDVKYKDSIKDFMKSMPGGDYVLLILGQGYLESKNCMFEAIELFKHAEFKKKVLPILMPNVEIHNALGRLKYTNYWQDKATELNSAIKGMANVAYIKEAYEELEHFNKIAEFMVAFTSALSDMRSVRWPDVRKDGYKEVFDYIGFTPNEQNIIQECFRISELTSIEEQEIELRKIPSDYKDNFYVLSTESHIAIKEEKYTKAIAILDKIVELYPTDAWQAHFNIGRILSESPSKYAEVKHHYESTLAISPNNSDAHYGLAVLLLDHNGDTQEALQHLIKAVVTNHDNADAHAALGLLLHRVIGNYDDARYHLERAVEINPALGGAQNNLAVLLKDIFEDDAKARKHLELAMYADPKNPDAPYNFAFYFLDDNPNTYAEAQRYYRLAIANNPRYADAYYWLAFSLSKYSNDKEGAREHYKIACELNPDLKSSEGDAFFGL